LPDSLTSDVTLRRLMLLGLGLGGGVVLGLFLWPFLPGLSLAIVSAALALPVHRRLEERIRRPAPAAMVSTIAVTLFVVIPVLSLAFLVGQETMVGVEWLAREAPALVREATAGRWSEGLLARASESFGLDAPLLSAMLADQLRQFGALLAPRTVSLVSGLGGGLLQSGIGIFTLYYLLRDHARLLAVVRWLIPLPADETDRLIERAREVTYATVFGNVLVAVVQGVILGLAFWMLGLPAAVLWGTVTGLLALIPIVGPPFVWAPAVLVLAVSGAPGKAAALLAVGLLLVSTVDNILRATIVSDRAHLHPLIVFFSVLGGLVVFGAAGIVIGPVVFVLALALLEMARQALDPGGRPPPDAPGLLTGPRTEPDT